MNKFWYILTNPFSTPLERLQRAWKELWKPLCRHRRVYARRAHASTVQNIPTSKLLYVDKHRVHVHIKCTDCGHVFDVDREKMRFNRLYEQGDA